MFQRVGRLGRAEPGVEARSRLEGEDRRVGCLLQRRRWDRPALEVDIEFVRAAADLVVRLMHGNLCNGW
eukprot:2465230-Prymnesium_polylepis.1